MIKIKIDGNIHNTIDKVHSEFLDQGRLPNYYGRNLSALWDCLSKDIEGPIEIAWTNSKSSEKSLGEDFHKIRDLLVELTEERDDVTLSFS